MKQAVTDLLTLLSSAYAEKKAAPQEDGRWRTPTLGPGSDQDYGAPVLIISMMNHSQV